MSSDVEAQSIARGGETKKDKEDYDESACSKNQFGTPHFILGLVGYLWNISIQVIVSGVLIGNCWVNSYQMQWIEIGTFIYGVIFFTLEAVFTTCAPMPIAGISKPDKSNYKGIRVFAMMYLAWGIVSAWLLYAFRHQQDPVLIIGLDTCDSSVFFTNPLNPAAAASIPLWYYGGLMIGQIWAILTFLSGFGWVADEMHPFLAKYGNDDT